MKQFLIFHKTSSLKFDLARIARPGEHTLHAVTRASGGVKLPADGWDYVDVKTTLDTWDLPALRTVVAAAIEAHGTENVRLLCHDEYTLLMVSQLREEFGLPGPKPEQVLRFTNKIVMKQHLAAAGVRIPKHTRVDAAAYDRDPSAEADRIVAATGLPAFAKQVAGTCSEGSARLDTRAELDAWLAGCPERGDYEVDEFLTGQLHHVDSVIVGGEPVHVQVNEYTFPNAEALAGKPLGTMSRPTDDELGRRLVEFNRACLSALAPLIDGTSHLELFRTPDDELVFLEIAARSPGAECPKQYEINSGFNFQEVYFKLHMGLPVNVERIPGPYVGWVWFPRGEGVVTGYHEPEVFSKYDFTVDVPVGERSSAAGTVRDRLCRVFLVNDDFAELARDFDYLRYTYEPATYG